MSRPITLSPDELERFGQEIDAIRERVLAARGERDADYIRRVASAQRSLEVLGRALLMTWPFPPAYGAGVLSLTVSKILENMELGHNIIHGQYDFMRDPAFDSKTYEWDTLCPASQWKHAHNFEHHTFTNILNKDRDVGYGLLRMADEQPWHVLRAGNPVYATALALFFDWGLALHDLELDRLLTGERPLAEALPLARETWEKARKLWLKEYLLFPLLAGPAFVPVLLGNASATVLRNLWTFAIIFCGHFPGDVATFDESEAEDPSRGAWYVRQLLGSANIDGGKLFHVLSGNLSHQIEHHLFPDLPAHRYAEISVEVRAVCQKFGLPYNTGGFAKQLGSSLARVARMALPPRKRAAEGAGAKSVRRADAGAEMSAAA